jgi:hypothetical protein
MQDIVHRLDATVAGGLSEPPACQQCAPKVKRDAMNRVRANTVLLIFIGATWAICCLVIWWRYHINLLIRVGSYQRDEAMSAVGRMSLIVTILTAAVWLFVRHRNRSGSQWRLVWNVAWKTATVLVLYVLIVLVRRQLWTESQGVNDSAMFLPLVGHVNAHFLSEFLWLIFLLEVVPIMALVSGLLYLAQARAAD